MVILNDRYGVRIDHITKTKEVNSQQTKEEANVKPAAPAQQTEAVQNNSNKDGNENFDYRDFEIEDESI